MNYTHTFHIPVMGIGFTIDTPLKVSQFGIDSVISLCDDILMEKMRKFYCEKFNLSYFPIFEHNEDFRAQRITAYLNLINDLAKKKMEAFKLELFENRNKLIDYFNMLPDTSILKQKFKTFSTHSFNWIKENLSMGSIDVNIMTKLDKANYKNGKKLPNEFNDAHAALRGFANSNLNSSVVFSAGMNPRLYTYIEEFKDFYPDKTGHFNKKIILKVSDYRSAYIQGKFLANKGLWVSEYRIESGLNCGGHAFASDGHLLGPILSEFRDKRDRLIQTMYAFFSHALSKKNQFVPEEAPPIKVTAQGGVGTSEEHNFLLNHYKLDSIGWASPFLLVPEVTNVDDFTLKLLSKSKEEDLYLSNISPLGVPFNSIRGNSKDLEKYARIDKGTYGSSCPKKFLVSNNEFTEKSICTASHQFQKLKLKSLEEENLYRNEYHKAFERIIDKSCICVGLGTPALLVNHIDTKIEGAGVSVCPGPNMAYFSKVISLKEMIDHIYGRSNIIDRKDRPNMFIKELNIYIDFLKDKISEITNYIPEKEKAYLLSFVKNINESINYYFDLFHEIKDIFIETKAVIIKDLNTAKEIVNHLKSEIEVLPLVEV